MGEVKKRAQHVKGSRFLNAHHVEILVARHFSCVSTSTGTTRLESNIFVGRPTCVPNEPQSARRRREVNVLMYR